MSPPQVHRKDVETITLSLPSRLELLPVVDRLIQGIAEQMDFDEDAAGEVAISVIEAGTNAIQHGHRMDAGKIVEFRFALHPDRLEISVHDSGPGFDPSKLMLRDPTSPEDLLRSSGRGIYIMRQMMDHVDFDIVPAKGTFCLLKKNKRGNGNPPAATGSTPPPAAS